MADSTTSAADKYPPYTTKALLMEDIRTALLLHANAEAVLMRLAHTDLNGTGSMTGGATVTPGSFNLE